MKPNITTDELKKAIEKISQNQPLGAYDFLEQATCIIIDEPIREVVVEAIRVRKKWHKIKMEYMDLKNDIGGGQAIRDLSEKYHYSIKTIEAIIYSR